MSHFGINVFTFYKQFYPKKMGEYKNHLSLDHEINKYNDSLNDLFDKYIPTNQPKLNLNPIIDPTVKIKRKTICSIKKHKLLLNSCSLNKSLYKLSEKSAIKKPSGKKYYLTRNPSRDNHFETPNNKHNSNTNSPKKTNDNKTHQRNLTNPSIHVNTKNHLNKNVHTTPISKHHNIIIHTPLYLTPDFVDNNYEQTIKTKTSMKLGNLLEKWKIETKEIEKDTRTLNNVIRSKKKSISPFTNKKKERIITRTEVNQEAKKFKDLFKKFMKKDKHLNKVSGDCIYRNRKMYYNCYIKNQPKEYSFLSHKEKKDL